MPAITPHPLVSGLTASAALAGCVLGKRLPLHKPDHYLGLSRQPFYLDWGNRDRELPAGWIPSDQWPGKGLPTRLSTFFSFDSRPLAPRDMLKIESRLRAINNVPSYDSPDSWARAINQMNQMFLELKHLRLRLITLGLSDNLLGLEEYFTINLEPVCDIFFAAFERHVMNLRNTDSLSPTAMKQYGDLAQAVSRLNATLAVIPLFYLGEADFLGKASLAYRKLYLRYPFIKLQKVLSPLGSSQTNPFDQQIVRQSILATDLERRTLLAGRVMTHEMYDKNLLTIAQSLLALATSSCDLLQSTPRPNPEEEQALLLLWQKKNCTCLNPHFTPALCEITGL